jgi:hypothetical protein
MKCEAGLRIIRNDMSAQEMKARTDVQAPPRVK